MSASIRDLFPGSEMAGSDEAATHACRWVRRRVWSEWTAAGEWRERLARQVSLCALCGRQRPARQPRPPVLRELRARRPGPAPLADAAGRRVAAALLRRGGVSAMASSELSAPGLLAALARQGVPASLAEEWLERFLRAGWLAATRTAGGSGRLVRVGLLAREALAELAHPGEAAARHAELAAARARVAGLLHPKSREIAALLDEPEAGDFPPLLLRALAALAVQAESGEPVAERVFSARHLGDSKALAALRGRLERLAGPLADLGVREGAAVTLLGGAGRLRLAGAGIDLPLFAPFLGLAREALDRLAGVALPEAGLLVVENLAAFEACCRGEVAGAGDCLVLWSAGYPGRAVRRLVGLAGAAPVRVWADLDLDGVRIARLIHSWAPAGARPWRMGPADLAAAAVRRPLPPRAAAAIRRDLAERPDALLAGTLSALLAAGCWAEQEALLAPARAKNSSP